MKMKKNGGVCTMIYSVFLFVFEGAEGGCHLYRGFQIGWAFSSERTCM
jgi:hypothetical protein